MALINKIKAAIESSIERSIYIPWNMSLGCCAVEVENSISATYDWQRLGVGRQVKDPSQADVLVISGWINDKYAAEIKTAHAQLGGSKSVIALGACVLSGSPYMASGEKPILAAQIVPVDIFVPGCPPRPEAILEAFQQLGQKRNPLKDQDKVIYSALRGPTGAP